MRLARASDRRCPSFARLAGQDAGRCGSELEEWMQQSRRYRAAAVWIALMLAPGVAAGAGTIDGADVPRMTASNGAVILMPEIASLDCDGMNEALRRIDLSKYRGPEPLPEGHPDRPIFDYEDRLAGRYYFACTLDRHRLEDPSSAFSFGFESQ